MKLPAYVHEANVAGLNKPAVVKVAKRVVVDNQPSLDDMANRINALAGNVEAQTALFEALPYEMQEALWDKWAA